MHSVLYRLEPAEKARDAANGLRASGNADLSVILAITGGEGSTATPVESAFYLSFARINTSNGFAKSGVSG